MSLRKILGALFDAIKSIFLNGLFTLLPITLTIFLFHFSLCLIRRWLAPLELIKPEMLREIPYAEFIIAMGILFGVGLISKFLLVRPLIHWLESLVMKIPLVRPVYSGIKQLTYALTHQDTVNIQQTVFIEFPRKGVWAIGFLTGSMPEDIAPNKQDTFYNIFIPTTPTPTTGYFVLVKEEEFVRSSLSRQEAMSLVISGGIIQPDRHVDYPTMEKKQS